VEAAVAAERPDDEHALLTGNEISSEKKSKKQQRKEELARMKSLKAKELRRKLEMVSSEGGLGGIGDEGISNRSIRISFWLHLLNIG
jgi:protein KRI1